MQHLGVDVDPLDRLAARIRDKEALAAVVGLGYVGLPLLVGMHAAGFRVIGVDSDVGKVDVLKDGRSHIVDVLDSEVAALDRASFGATPDVLRDADVIVLCLPTPLADGAPDLTMVLAAAEDVARYLTPGTLVVLESTTYPGTTEEALRPILETSGLQAGRDFALGYSPERIDPGNHDHALDTTPKIVSGITEHCRELTASFYGQFIQTVVSTSSPREAEMAKLIENTYRQVNIALVNELAILARGLGVDIWEALSAAATKPFGYQPFWPGPGVGGHCISIDPTYLSWKAAQQLGHRVEFIEHANEVNNRMPDYVVTRVGEALNDAGKPIKGSQHPRDRRGLQAGRRGPPRISLARRPGSPREEGSVRRIPRPLRPHVHRGRRTHDVAGARCRNGRRARPRGDPHAAPGARRARSRSRRADGVRHPRRHPRHRRGARRAALEAITSSRRS